MNHGRVRARIVALLRQALPRRLRQQLLRLAASVSREDFPELAYRILGSSNPEAALKSLAARGFKPKLIVDVGAYEGEWTKLARSVWPMADIRMIEPNPSKVGKLTRVGEETGASLLASLLGAKDGEQVMFHLMETGSSVFEERSSVGRQPISLPLRSLDGIAGDQTVDLLKIDVQGYELEVLKGAERSLKTTGALVLECSLVDINKGAPLLHEVLAFLADRGFVAYDLIELHRRPRDGVLWQVDLIFVPVTSSLRESRSFD